MTVMDGFLNLHKPQGWTSHDCVAKVRSILSMKRIGHGGTLDPAATGVLPLALGRATRLLQYLPKQKAYQATIRLGLTTTTDDLDGTILSSQPCPHLTSPDVVNLLQQFIGTIQQIPPKYSAIHVEGKRLYDLARAGIEVDIPVRTVEIYDIHLLEWRTGDFPELDLYIRCGSGTYIRSIARDLGDLTGTGATLARLIRTESSGFGLGTSMDLETLNQQVTQERFIPISAQDGLQHLPTLVLSPEFSTRWLMGQKLPLIPTLNFKLASATQFTPAPTQTWPQIVQVHDQKAKFLGIGHPVATNHNVISQWTLRPKVVFN